MFPLRGASFAALLGRSRAILSGTVRRGRSQDMPRFQLPAVWWWPARLHWGKLRDSADAHHPQRCAEEVRLLVGQPRKHRDEAHVYSAADRRNLGADQSNQDVTRVSYSE